MALVEVISLIPVEQQKIYRNDEWFNGASGFIELSRISDGSKETFIAMLLMNEYQTRVLYLYVTKYEAIFNDDGLYTLVKDFTQGDLG